jgi:hypothetical protein
MPEDGGVIYPDWPVAERVGALVTTREGGSSQGPYTTYNLADHVGDNPHDVQLNRARLAARIGTGGPLLWLRQVHGTRVVAAADWKPGCMADAAWTDRPGCVCVVLTADCLPVLLATADGSVVAAAHAGWRGLAGGVLEATVAALPVAPGHLRAWLGPAIGPRHYEVDVTVRSAFLAVEPGAEAAFTGVRPGHWLVDLYYLARLHLARAGVVRVYGGLGCTYAEGERFYSYRRDGRTGRMASVVWIRG